jgi:hypothetical protein
MARAFGSARKNMYQSDYIAEKKTGKKIYYNASNNKTDLISGLYSKTDMSSVCSVVDGLPFIDVVCTDLVHIDSKLDVPFYISNTIDPLGLLYNYDKCIKQNYITYNSLSNIDLRQ